MRYLVHRNDSRVYSSGSAIELNTGAGEAGRTPTDMLFEHVVKYVRIIHSTYEFVLF